MTLAKLKTILFCTVLLLGANRVNGQMVYQYLGISLGDVSGSDCGTDQIPIDFDANGIPDAFVSSNNSCIDPVSGYVAPANLIIEPALFGGGILDMVSTNQWISTGPGGPTLSEGITPLEQGTLIDGLSVNFSDFYAFSDMEYSPFNGIGERFIGFSLTSNDLSTIFYGWMRVSMNQQYITIIDSAIRTEPYTPVIAGETLSCNPPINLGNTPATSTSRQIGWNASGSTIDGYEVSVVLKGEQPIENGEYYQNTFITVSGLRPGVSYDAYVRNVCGSGSSAWIGPSSFRIDHQTEQGVACGPNQIVETIYTENFDNLSNWTGNLENGTGTWFAGSFEGLEGTDENSAPNQADVNSYVYYSNGPGSNVSATLKSNYIDLTECIGPVEMVFYMHDLGDWTTGRLDVDVLTQSGVDKHLFDWEGALQGEASAPWEEVAIDLTEFNGEPINVKFTYWSPTDIFIGKMGVDFIKINSCLPQAPSCPADVNGDGFVNVNDFLALNSLFGLNCTCPEDITGDGEVNINDFLSFNSAFGTVCN